MPKLTKSPVDRCIRVIGYTGAAWVFISLLRYLFK